MLVTVAAMVTTVAMVTIPSNVLAGLAHHKPEDAELYFQSVQQVVASAIAGT
jgi:hypothetical protein